VQVLGQKRSLAVANTRAEDDGGTPVDAHAPSSSPAATDDTRIGPGECASCDSSLPRRREVHILDLGCNDGSVTFELGRSVAAGRSFVSSSGLSGGDGCLYVLYWRYRVHLVLD
jgi:hypothetical protein